MSVYTDLADEIYSPRKGSVPPGVRFATRRSANFTLTRVLISRSGLARPQGRYVVFETPALPALDIHEDPLADAVAQELRAILPAEGGVLVVGVGNRRITADALGPRCAGQVLVTRGLGVPAQQLALREVTAIAPGVTGRTGLALPELLAGLVQRTHPAAVLCVDSLAAAEPARLGRTIQLSDTGLCPAQPGGARCVTAQQLGVPVLALGIPTLMDAAELTGCKGLVLAPRELDATVEKGAALLALAINRALHPALSRREIHYLVS